jgi:hypothetical protein
MARIKSISLIGDYVAVEVIEARSGQEARYAAEKLVAHLQKAGVTIENLTEKDRANIREIAKQKGWRVAG